MEAQELQLDKRLWIIPSSKAKNGDSQTVPLPVQVTDIIKTAQTFSSGSWIFRAPRKEGQPVSGYALAQAMRRALADLDMPHATPHDLRRTAATYISELGFNRMVVDKILNHKDGSTTGIYDRYSYDKEKREALEAWNNELDLILAGKGRPKVVDIGSAIGTTG
jgi:integrase